MWPPTAVAAVALASFLFHVEVDGLLPEGQPLRCFMASGTRLVPVTVFPEGHILNNEPSCGIDYSRTFSFPCGSCIAYPDLLLLIIIITIITPLL